MATHFFHKVVYSAHLFMEKASWGCWFLVVDSSEPAVHPDVSDSFAPGCSENELDVGRTTSCEDGVGATVNAPMD